MNTPSEAPLHPCQRTNLITWLATPGRLTNHIASAKLMVSIEREGLRRREHNSNITA